MKFNELNLPDYMLKGLEAQGFESCTEIQELSIPIIREKKDMVGLSQTGSGKTYAFSIPAIEMVDSQDNNIQALIICPTRELVTQVVEEMRKLSTLRENAKIVPIYGGASMSNQIQALKRNAKIVVGTPGRIMDHLRRKTMKLNRIKMLVLDEADEMLNMGFRDDIETILKSTNVARQTVMFSATMPQAIMNITKEYMVEPIVVKSSQQDNNQAFIKQYYTTCGRDNKVLAFKNILQSFNPKTAIVFCNTKRMVDNLTKDLADEIEVFGLHGDLRQSQRRQIMDKFKKQGQGILIATDVAARGIDVKNVDMVINFDLPYNNEYYIHRIGRTARAGKEGVAITIINTKDQLKNLTLLEKDTKNNIEEFLSDNSVVFNISHSRSKGGKDRTPSREKSKSNFKSNRSFDRDKKDNEKSYLKNNDRKRKFDDSDDYGQVVKQNKKFESKRQSDYKSDSKKDSFRSDRKRDNFGRDSKSNNRFDNKKSSKFGSKNNDSKFESRSNDRKSGEKSFKKGKKHIVKQQSEDNKFYDFFAKNKKKSKKR